MVAVEDHLHHVGVVIQLLADLIAAGSHDLSLVADESLGDLVDDLGHDQGLVALNVDDVLAVVVAGHLGDTVTAGGVVGCGQHGLAAESLDGVHDALVIGGDHQLVDELSLAGALVDVLDHGLAQDVLQGLAGQTGRAISGRNDTNRFHFSSS